MLYLGNHLELDTCTFELSSSQWTIISPPEISKFPPESLYIILSSSVFKALIPVGSNLWLSSYAFIARLVEAGVLIYVFLHALPIFVITKTSQSALTAACIWIIYLVFLWYHFLDSATTRTVERLPGRPRKKPFKAQRLAHSIALRAMYVA
jgi:hypothetical protein